MFSQEVVPRRTWSRPQEVMIAYVCVCYPVGEEGGGIFSLNEAQSATSGPHEAVSQGKYAVCPEKLRGTAKAAYFFLEHRKASTERQTSTHKTQTRSTVQRTRNSVTDVCLKRNIPPPPPLARAPNVGHKQPERRRHDRRGTRWRRRVIISTRILGRRAAPFSPFLIPNRRVIISTRISGRRTAPFSPFLIPNRPPHGVTPRS